MRKKQVNRLLRIIAVLTLIVWVLGFFGIWGSLYGLVVMGLITVFFILIFVGFINDHDFLS